MAMSGISIPQDVIKVYDGAFKLKRDHRYLILEIATDAVHIKAKGPKDATPDDFANALAKEKDYCYGVYSGETKIGYLIYGPPEADFKKGMIYASTAASKTMNDIAIKISIM